MSDEGLTAQAEEALRGVIDPELGINVVDLGLIYRLEAKGDTVEVDLTMTTAACPLGEQIVLDARQRLAALPGVGRAEVKLVWEPKWTADRMSSAARHQLGWDE